MDRSDRFVNRGLSVLLLLSLILPSISAQQLRGTVVRKDTRAPISSVDVYLKGTTHGAATDTLGVFAISGIPPGTYVVEVRHVGFKPNRYILTAEAGQSATLNAELEEEPVVVEGVEVTGEAEKARRLATLGKTIITAEQIQRAGATSLSTFLKSQYPGLFPIYTRRTYERLKFILFVNGALVQYTADVLDSMIDVDKVDYIEVYRDFGMTSTRDRGSNERVIHIHTKLPPPSQ